MLKKVSALKRISGRLKKTWSANNKKIRKKIKLIKQKTANKNKNKFTIIEVCGSNANHVEGESIDQILKTSQYKGLSVCYRDVIPK